MNDHTDDVLVQLSDTNLTLSDPNEDIRDRKVTDQHGADIGHVSGLFIDRDEKKVRMLQVAAGGFLGLGERHFLVRSKPFRTFRLTRCESIRRASASPIRRLMIRT